MAPGLLDSKEISRLIDAAEALETLSWGDQRADIRWSPSWAELPGTFNDTALTQLLFRHAAPPDKAQMHAIVMAQKSQPLRLAELRALLADTDESSSCSTVRELGA